MKSRVVAAAVGALSLLSLAACASSGGTGASPGTTVKLGAASFVTLPPVLTSTTVTTIAGQTEGVVAGEQPYTVLGGDALYSIAKKFCVQAQAIADFNSWPDLNHNLFAGDVIKIPPGACAPGSNTETTNAATQDTTPSSEATSDNTTTTFDTSTGGFYVVKEGDTLYGIATKNGTTAEAIATANGWDSIDHVIYKGLKIKLPAKTG